MKIKSKAVKAIVIILSILVGLACCVSIYALCVNHYIVSSSEKYILDVNSFDGDGDFDCILVLGAGVHGTTLSHMLEDRVKTGITLYENGASKKILMSGDHGRENYDEVNAMKSYAIDKGVISSDIFMDHAGFSTYESMYRARDVFAAKKVLIVTQKYHLYRAIYVARYLGLDAYGVDAQLREYAGHTNIYNTLREFLARNKDFLYVRLNPAPTYLGDVIEINGNGDLTNDKI